MLTPESTMHIQFHSLALALAASLGTHQALAQNSSPFPPPPEKLGTYVASEGAGLDTGCTYRGGGPLRINIPVPVVVNAQELNADGTLKDPQKLIANRVLSAQAKIRFPVYDIDDKENTNGEFAPEVDQLSFNGRAKKTLEGFNDTWTDDTIVVPIEEIKFGKDNELRVDIDTANVDLEYWCMAVDWVAIGFDITPTDFEIVSLSTLSTPHLGSVAADLALIQKQSANDKINNGNDPNGFASAYIDTWTFGQGPQLPGLADLTTYAATAALSTGLRNNVARTFTVGADADLNHDNTLTSNESTPLFPSVAHYAAERAWLVLRDFNSAPMDLTIIPGQLWGTRTVLTYTTNVAPARQANDIVVTLRSANPGYGTPLDNSMANHSTVKTGANVNAILDATIPIK
jgi:hypothetical protein